MIGVTEDTTTISIEKNDKYEEPEQDILKLIQLHNKPRASPMDLLTKEHFESLAGVLKISTSLPATQTGRDYLKNEWDNKNDTQLIRGMEVSENIIMNE